MWVLLGSSLRSTRTDRDLLLALSGNTSCRVDSWVWVGIVTVNFQGVLDQQQESQTSAFPENCRSSSEQEVIPKSFRQKFCRGRPRGMSVPECLFLQDLEGLTFWPDPKLPLWDVSSFLKLELYLTSAAKIGTSQILTLSLKRAQNGLAACRKSIGFPTLAS